MRISSFDIFNTCVVRKCGAPRNLFDVLSYRVFSRGVSTEQRLEFIACRLASDDSSTFSHLYETFDYTHPLLLSKESIMQKELECEYEMMVPVDIMKMEIEQCRDRGDHIIFISDMYLPTDFLKRSLSEFGILREEDTLYVSGDCGHKKSDGTLFQFIQERENLDFSKWHHYGDNPHSDIQIPCNLGIKTHLVNHKYLPYEQKWIDNSNNITYHTGGIMAGIGQSIYLSTEDNLHKAFAIDISAPLTTAFAMRIMYDAEKRGLKRLYFCARDCYALYHVAKKIERVTPSVEPVYFYTSREALYNTNEKNLIDYLVHIGMANTDNHVGIVDIRSTGNSPRYLNEILQKNNYNPVFGYYLEMFCSDFFTKGMFPYYCEINRLYCDLFSHHHPILEKFLSICPDNKTIQYSKQAHLLSETPLYEDYYIEGLEKLSAINLSILCKYADSFIETELYRHCDEMFQYFVIPTLKQFFSHPYKKYLFSLRYLHILQEDGSSIPYIEETVTGIPLKIAQIAKASKIRIVRRLMKFLMRMMHIKPLPKDVWWPEGTKIYNSK